MVLPANGIFVDVRWTPIPAVCIGGGKPIVAKSTSNRQPVLYLTSPLVHLKHCRLGISIRCVRGPGVETASLKMGQMGQACLKLHSKINIVKLLSLPKRCILIEQMTIWSFLYNIRLSLNEPMVSCGIFDFEKDGNKTSTGGMSM